jgi:hypothetical protein
VACQCGARRALPGERSRLPDFRPPGPHENFGLAFELIAVLVQLVSLGGAGLLLLAFRKTRRAGTHALIALALLLVAWLISTLLPPLSFSE